MCGQSCLTLRNPMNYSLPVLLCPLDFSSVSPKYWSGLPFSRSGNFPNPGVESASPALAGGFFSTGPSGKPKWSNLNSITAKMKSFSSCLKMLVIRSPKGKNNILDSMPYLFICFFCFFFFFLGAFGFWKSLPTSNSVHQL